MTFALEGIKVIDASQVAAVPISARHLGDFGADVLHIENPETGDSWRGLQAGQGGNAGVESTINYNWEAFNRNKKSVTIDLSKEQGQKIIYRLVEQADVFMTNLRLWEREKFNVGYEHLSKINPRLIYGSLTAFGEKGGERNTPAYDWTSYWSRSGLAYMLTTPGGSAPNFRPAFGDNVTGLMLAYGIIMALFVREKTGIGQEVDVSLLHSGYYQMTFDISGALATHQDYEDWRFRMYGLDKEKTNQLAELLSDTQQAIKHLTDFYRLNAANPLAIGYETKDGIILRLAAIQADRSWPDLCRAIEQPELAYDPRFNSTETRNQYKTELISILDEAFKKKTLAEWRAQLNFLPVSTINNLVEAINDPQARANDMFISYKHPVYGEIEAIASPIKMSKTPATYRLPAPEFNQHTEEALLAIGYTWEDIARFKEQGVIG